MVCVFFFYKGKNMEICLEKTDFHCLISFYGKSDIGDIYGYIQSYDPQLPCLLYAIDDTSSTRLLWWSNKIMIEKRNITKSRIAIILHIMFIIFKKKKMMQWLRAQALTHNGAYVWISTSLTSWLNELCKLCNYSFICKME